MLCWFFLSLLEPNDLNFSHEFSFFIEPIGNAHLFSINTSGRGQ